MDNTANIAQSLELKRKEEDDSASTNLISDWFETYVHIESLNAQWSAEFCCKSKKKPGPKAINIREVSACLLDLTTVSGVPVLEVQLLNKHISLSIIVGLKRASVHRVHFYMLSFSRSFDGYRGIIDPVYCDVVFYGVLTAAPLPVVIIGGRQPENICVIKFQWHRSGS